MMPEAFVLFKTEPTHEREVYLTLSDHDGVAEVHALYGEFDLLVRITSPTSKELSHLLMESFRPGVQMSSVKLEHVLRNFRTCMLLARGTGLAFRLHFSKHVLSAGGTGPTL